MRSIQLTVFISILATIGLCAPVLAGGSVGQTAVGFLVSDASPTFSFRYWYRNSATVELSFSGSRVSGDSLDQSTRLRPGFGLAYHWSFGSNLRPYVGFGFALDILLEKNENPMDYYFGPAFGVEYFLSDRLSIAGENQVVIVDTDNERSVSGLKPDVTLVSTAQHLIVHFYF